MPQKSSRIDDVKRPDKVAPSATSRPLLVTNQPTMASDPMMAPTDESGKDGEQTLTMNHTAKTIKPSDAVLVESASESSIPRTKEGSSTLASAAIEAQPPKATASAGATRETSIGASMGNVLAGGGLLDAGRDPDAAITAEEATAAEAKARRDQELEVLIESGKYTVPIDAVRRHRSHVASVVLGLVALLLAIVLLDAIVDAGIVKLPSSVPHTHFFSAK